MNRPLLSLVMIVKDEAASIGRTLESVLPFVDHGTVVDTGSADKTPDIVIDAFKAADKQLHLHNERFVDYAATRNRALCLDQVWEDETRDTQQAVFTLMLSADEVLHGGAELRAFLEQYRDTGEGAFCVTMQTDSRQWPYPRVLRSDAGWRYQGAVHERPVSPQGSVVAETVPGVRVIHTESDPTRKMKRLREFDLPLLTREVEDESKSLVERASSIFFLAETHAVIASRMPDEAGNARLSHLYASMALYWRYAQIAEQDGGARDFDKAMYAYAMHYDQADKANVYAPRELAARLQVLCGSAPNQAEAHLMLALAAAKIDVRQGLLFALKSADCAKRVLQKPPLTVPVDTRLEWLSLQLAAECAVAFKDDKRAKAIADKALAAGCPPERIRFVEKQRA